ncbi:hypothetical protein V2G26_021205 [Clonostachys chloroleuca]
MMTNFFLSAVLCQLMAALVFAAPVAEDAVKVANKDAIGYGAGGGFIGVVVLILDIITIVEILKSNRPPLSKLLWSLVVFFFPIIGMIIYYLFSNRHAHNTYEPLP